MCVASKGGMLIDSFILHTFIDPIAPVFVRFSNNTPLPESRRGKTNQKKQVTGRNLSWKFSKHTA